MKNNSKFGVREWVTSSISVVLSLLFIVTIVHASTTISADIQTGGTLSVTGTSTLSGKVGIATSTPSSNGSFLTVVGDGTTGNTADFWGPNDARFTIFGDSGQQPLEEHNSFANGLALYTHASGNQTFRAPPIALKKSRGTMNAPTAVQTNDLLGYLQWFGYGATQYIEGSVIESVAAENWTDTAAGTDINFYANTTGSNSLTLRMKIRNDGRLGLGSINEATTLGSVLSVAGTASIGTTYATLAAPTSGLIVQGNTGIGTSTPIANLQVANGSNATTTMEVGSANQNKGSCLKLYRTDGSAIYAYVAAGATTFTLSTTACASVSGF